MEGLQCDPLNHLVTLKTRKPLILMLKLPRHQLALRIRTLQKAKGKKEVKDLALGREREGYLKMKLSCMEV